mmetsp:Transcript_62121/g.147189  ORF Transcript_62121/g.147189 Transcript_62121/m.147189 type:complete len:228 (-) Transcript_62121:206-889(-)
MITTAMPRLVAIWVSCWAMELSRRERCAKSSKSCRKWNAMLSMTMSLTLGWSSRKSGRHLMHEICSQKSCTRYTYVFSMMPSALSAFAAAVVASSCLMRAILCTWVVKASAISKARSDMKLPSVSMYTASPSAPPKICGRCASTASWIPSWVLPMPGVPTNSVTSPIGTPPPSMPSISPQKVMMGERLRVVCRISSADRDTFAAFWLAGAFPSRTSFSTPSASSREI